MTAGWFNKPHGFHLLGKSVVFVVKSMTLGFNPPVCKALEFETEWVNINEAVKAYYNLIEVLRA